MSNMQENSSRLVYESLAPVYLTIGVVVPLVIQNIWAVGSGLVWLSAGSLAIWRRKSYRNINRKGLIQTLRADSGATQLVWSKRFECGNSYIDNQYQQLFNGFNALNDAIQSKRNKEDIDLLVDGLMGEVTSHFRSEEELLADWNHPLAETQQALHEGLLRKATQLRDKLRDGKLSHQHFFNFLITDIVYGHIDLEDRKYFHEI